MKFIKLLITTCMIFILCACNKENQKETIHIACAASLKNVFENEIIPAYKKNHDVNIKGIYDSSGKLQTQIQNGLDVDLFFSASMKNIQNLKIINQKDLLVNELVLIQNKDLNINSIYDIEQGTIIAVGDEASVPAGMYAKEALEALNLYDTFTYSKGSNVTEVLQWVASNSASYGIVYKTDAYSNENVCIVESLEVNTPVIYPLVTLSNDEETKLFYEFLQSDEVKEYFINAGFTMN